MMTLGLCASMAVPSIGQTTHYASGVDLYRQGKFQEALTELQLAAEEDTTSALLFFVLGLTQKKLKAYDAAIVSYKRVIQIDPEYVKAYAAMGDLFFERGDMALARESYGEAIEVDPTFRTGYRQLSAVHLKTALDLYKRGKFEEAAEEFLQATTFDSSRASTFFNLGASYRQLSRWDQAARAYGRALEIDSTYVDAYLSLGDMQTNLDQREDALKSGLSLTTGLIPG